jgi:regulator of sigma D
MIVELRTEIEGYECSIAGLHTNLNHSHKESISHIIPDENLHKVCLEAHKQRDILENLLKEGEANYKSTAIEKVAFEESLVTLQKTYEELEGKKDSIEKWLDTRIQENVQYKQITKEKIEQEKVLKEELHVIQGKVANLEEEHNSVVLEHEIVKEKEAKLEENNNHYQKIIAQLMNYPDLSLNLDLDLKGTYHQL